jgi:hypothetical protein
LGAFPNDNLCWLYWCIPVGGLLGYLAGGLIAAHFLLIDKLKSLRVPSSRRWRKEAEQE